jgi:hypothetical protein
VGIRFVGAGQQGPSLFDLEHLTIAVEYLDTGHIGFSLRFRLSHAPPLFGGYSFSDDPEGFRHQPLNLGKDALLEKLHASAHKFVRHVADFDDQVHMAVVEFVVHGADLIDHHLRRAAQNLATLDALLDRRYLHFLIIAERRDCPVAFVKPGFLDDQLLGPVDAALQNIEKILGS